ncbi:MAG: FtsW/RodA/SpoVE family cell cycle protein [Bacteroidales bacterium]
MQYNRYLKGDRTLWMILLFLSIISVLAVASASSSIASRQNNSISFYITKHLTFLLAGFAIIIFQIKCISLKYYKKLSLLLVLISAVLLVVNLLFSHGRSLSVFGIIAFQPQELAKISLVIFAANMFAKCNYDTYEVDKTFWKVLGVSAIVCLLISLRDFSTAALLFVTIFVMMLAVGVRKRKLLGIIAAGLLGIGVLYLVADNVPAKYAGRMHTVKARIDGFIGNEPTDNTSVEQADYFRYSIYKGGHGAAGPGRSKMRVYAAAYNDFIYSIIVEEYSFFPLGILIILLYAWILYRGAKAGDGTKDPFAKFMALGLGVLISFQAFINIGVNVGLFPVTGQPLPWVSMGGTSMLFTAFSFGIILSIGHQNDKEKLDRINRRKLQTNGNV